MDMNYVEEVSSIFQARCGKTILAPEDYAQIAEWEKQEIPLEVVAVTIDLTSYQLDGVETEIKSIRYFNDAIKTNFRRWLQMQDRRPNSPSKQGN